MPDNSIRRIWQSQDGRIWFLTWDGQAGSFSPDNLGPETMLEPALKEISSAGNILVRWSGRDQWDSTPPQEMRYQWRMDGGDWSAASNLQAFTFTSLFDGAHRFEVRAMDRDGNFDATPAVHAFVVEAPWWQNPWVIGPMVVLLVMTGVQTGRVVRRDRRLQQTNTALSSANKELFGLNQDPDQSNQALQQKTDDLDQSNQALQQKTDDLTVEAALERVRAQALGMQQSRDLWEVSKALSEEFKRLEIPHFRSAINYHYR